MEAVLQGEGDNMVTCGHVLKHAGVFRGSTRGALLSSWTACFARPRGRRQAEIGRPRSSNLGMIKGVDWGCEGSH